MADFDGYILFCEDVREEVGGKQSFMGVFGPQIILDGNMPPVMTLAAVVMCRFKGDPPKTAFVDIRFVDGPENGPPAPGRNPLQMVAPPDHHGVWTSNIIGKFMGLPVKDGMRVDVVAEIDDEVLTASIEIQVNAPDTVQ